MNASAPSAAADLRVGVLAASFHPVVGGGERHAHLLCRELARRGARVRVVTRRRTRDVPALETLDGFEVVRVAPVGFPRLGKYLMLAPALLRLWRDRRDFDLLYVCGLRVLGWTGILAQLLLRKPCVLRAEARGELDGHFIWQTPEGRILPLRRAAFRPLVALRNALFRRADRFLAISTPIREEFLAVGVSADRIAEIPNGLDLDHFQPAGDGERPFLRQKLGLPPDALLFAYAGKLNRGKGLERLLRVWARFAPLQPRARLLLIGSGGGQHLSCEAALRLFVAENHLRDSVLFTGYVADVPAHLQAADAFVFPSESEAQGLAPLEAMACRLPVFASRIPGVMDMIVDGRNGRLIPHDDEDAWLQALRDFAADPASFRRMAEAGHQTTLSRYGIAAACDRHVELFRSILAERLP